MEMFSNFRSNIVVKLPMYFLLMMVCLAIFPSEAHAGYLDPGSGSIFVQSILSFFAFCGKIFNRIKSFFTGGSANE